MCSSDIDFVVPWVNSDDPEWQAAFRAYTEDQNGADARIHRYRDNGLLKYWFRGVEKNAPWVRKIHFVTFGHLPEWLNVNNEKINIVKHSDYIDNNFLPTFNSHVIELNLHRIKELSRQFVYFNDDTFLINPIESSYYFYKGKPCDCAILNAVLPGGLAHVIYNNLEIINKYFKKNDVIKKNFFKWFNPVYGKDLIRTACLLPWPQFVGIKDTHLPIAYLKETFEELWQKEDIVLTKTNNSKFRRDIDLNQYVFRYWQLMKGDFHCKNTLSNAAYLDISKDTLSDIQKQLVNKKNKLIVINDGDVKNFSKISTDIVNVFDTMFPNKSSFEL